MEKTWMKANNHWEGKIIQIGFATKMVSKAHKFKQFECVPSLF